MKVVILAGGLGTRISEESYAKPKPMITIGDQPILWHIMKMYSQYGFRDFVICCGYKSYVIKEYFANYYLHRSDVTFDFSEDNRMTVHENVAEPWRVTLVDTGVYAQTGARVKRVQKYIGNETFMLTYGDGVSNVDLNALLSQHRASDKVVTLTGIQPGSRFGVLDIGNDEKTIVGFRDGSTAGLWLWSQRYLTIYGTRTPAFWKENRWNRWQGTANWESISTRAFGSAWIRSGTKSGLKRCGKKGIRRGRYGRNDVVGILSRQTRFCHGTYGL